VRVVDCLDECDRSNVVVVRRGGARARDRDTWLGDVLPDRATAALTAWVAAGAVEPLPPELAGRRFRHVPPRRRRA
jgi:predicted metal-binding protein